MMIGDGLGREHPYEILETDIHGGQKVIPPVLVVVLQVSRDRSK